MGRQGAAGGGAPEGTAGAGNQEEAAWDGMTGGGRCGACVRVRGWVGVRARVRVRVLACVD